MRNIFPTDFLPLFTDDSKIDTKCEEEDNRESQQEAHKMGCNVYQTATMTQFLYFHHNVQKL